MVTGIAELQREFYQRARQIGLKVDCPPDGAFHSEIAIVAEAPGEREVQTRVPLWTILRKYDIDRRKVYVTNVVKKQLSLSASRHNNARNPISNSELSHWQSLLEWELSLLPNLKYILVLGSTALRSLTRENKITDWRGSVLPTRIRDRKCTVVATYNPAAVLREPKWEVTFRFDIGKFNRVITGKYQPHPVEAHYDPSPTEAIEWCDKMQDEKLPVSFDIETISRETACVGFANNNHVGYCINLRGQTSNRFTPDEERLVRRRIQSLFADTGVSFVAQNGSFDSYWLWYKDRIKVHAVWFDTLLAHHTLYPQLPHNLGFLTSQYTTHPFYKDEGKTWREGGNIAQFWEYNVKDCCITRAVQMRELEELQAQKLDEFFFNHVMRLQPHLVRMTVLGIKCDLALKGKISDALVEDVANMKAEFVRNTQIATNMDDLDINPNSSKQLQDLFFRHLKLVGRGVSTDKANRERMMAHPRTTPEAHAVLQSLGTFKKEHKFLTTYALMEVDKDGRCRSEYKQFGTQKAPGRLSSASNMWNTGTNLQNQPKRAYPMFIADEGKEFTYFDLSQAEARVVARIANVQTLRENFDRADSEQGYDVHRANASRIFKVPYDDVPKADRDADGEPTKRFLGKRCVHGLNYRMGADKLAEVCGIPIRQAESAWHAYHRAFPEIRVWWEAVETEVRKSGQLFTSLGRRMFIMERLTPESMESIVAFEPQSTIGDFVSSIIYKLHDDPEWPDTARVMLNIHDALIAQHDPQDHPVVARLMKKHAEAPLLIHEEPLVIPIELKRSVPDAVGIHRWSTLEDVACD
jgi:uracil-DNA glycosylase family 4